MAAMERRAIPQRGRPRPGSGRFGALARRVVETIGNDVAGLYLTRGDIMVVPPAPPSMRTGSD
ncbi:MAG: hypothetical protein R2719_13720 [Micropruina sp.]